MCFSGRSGRKPSQFSLGTLRMTRISIVLVCLVLGGALRVPCVWAQDQHQHQEHHHMQLDATGMVMNENTDQLPRGCARLAGEQAITVQAGREFATPYPGTMFAYDQHEWQLPACTKLSGGTLSPARNSHRP